MACHLFTREYSAWILCMTYRAWDSVGYRITVGTRLTTKIMTLDSTGKPLTNRNTGNIYLLAGLKYVLDIDLLTCLVIFYLSGVKAELSYSTACFHSCFCIMTCCRFVYTRRTALTKSHLQGSVTVDLWGLYLSDAII